LRWSNRGQTADDPDLIDQRLQQRLAGRRVAALDHLAHVGDQQRQVLVAQRLVLVLPFGGGLEIRGPERPLRSFGAPGSGVRRRAPFPAPSRLGEGVIRFLSEQRKVRKIALFVAKCTMILGFVPKIRSKSC
jgi:hypothetical protein